MRVLSGWYSQRDRQFSDYDETNSIYNVTETPTSWGAEPFSTPLQRANPQEKLTDIKTGLDKFFVNEAHRETNKVHNISEPASKPPVVNGENQRFNSIRGKKDKLDHTHYFLRIQSKIY